MDDSQAGGGTLPTTYCADDAKDFSEDEEPVVVWGRLFSETPGFETIELCEDTYILGRHEDCTVRYTDPSISSKHCIITRERPQDCASQYADGEFTVWVEDRSSNGTYVNGQRVGKGKRMALFHNNKLSLTNRNKHSPSYIFHDARTASETTHPALRDRYNIMKALGSGACGEVHQVVENSSGRKYAVKIISKRRFNSTGGGFNVAANQMLAEVEILRKLDHPNIIHVHDMIDTPENLYIILELALGGDLFDRVSGKSHFTEDETRFVFYQLLEGVEYIHSQGVAHRDLKLENVLLSSGSDDALVKITDFGLAKLVGPQSFMKTMCGTPSYQAPEVLLANSMQGGDVSASGYDKAVDMWSLGVILYICLCGFPPFSDDPEWTDVPMFKQITEAKYSFPGKIWQGISADAKDLVNKLLVVNPRDRLTVQAAKDHPFLQCPEIIARIREKQDKDRQRRLEVGQTQTSAVKRRGDDRASDSPAEIDGNGAAAKKAP